MNSSDRFLDKSIFSCIEFHSLIKLINVTVLRLFNEEDEHVSG